MPLHTAANKADSPNPDKAAATPGRAKEPPAAAAAALRDGGLETGSRGAAHR